MKKTVEILFRLLSKDYEMDANTQEVCRYGLDIFLHAGKYTWFTCNRSYFIE